MLLADKINLRQYCNEYSANAESPIDELIHRTDTLMDAADAFINHMKELSEKYPGYRDYRYVYKYDADDDWFELHGIE